MTDAGKNPVQKIRYDLNTGRLRKAAKTLMVFVKMYGEIDKPNGRAVYTKYWPRASNPKYC
jgi:hypothetical protein